MSIEIENNIYTIEDEEIDDIEYLETIDQLRSQIDEVDTELMNLLSKRMKLAESIGAYKKRNNMTILQPNRWNEILEKAQTLGKVKGLSGDFMEAYLRAVHQESINHQEEVMSKTKV